MDIRYISTAGYNFYPCESYSEGEMTAVPVCEPDISSDERGLRHMDAEELKPGMRVISEVVLPPVIEVKSSFSGLDMDTEELKPSMKAFPDPLT